MYSRRSSSSKKTPYKKKARKSYKSPVVPGYTQISSDYSERYKTMASKITKELKYRHGTFGPATSVHNTFVGGENHVYPNIANSVGGYAGDDGTLLSIDQGSSGNQREGRKINVKTIAVRLSFDNQGKVPSSRINIRAMLVLDKQCNGTTATDAQILDTLTTNYANSNNTRLAQTFGYQNITNSDRFKILDDKIGLLVASSNWIDPLVTTAVNPACGVWQTELKFKGDLPIQYADTTATGVIANIRSNNVFVYMCCSTAGDVSADQVIFCRGAWEVRYFDD